MKGPNKEAPNDLVGRKIGMLTIVRPYMLDQNRHWTYICECECGKKCIKSRTYLTQRMDQRCPKSCGCAAPRINSQDLVGRKISFSEVIAYHDWAGGANIYKCRCECGAEFFAKRDKLMGGIRGKYKVSCGCKNSAGGNKPKTAEERTAYYRGKKFGMLEIDRVDSFGAYWWKCECGKVCRVSRANVVSGITVSCGCVSPKEYFAKNNPQWDPAIFSPSRGERLKSITRREIDAAVGKVESEENMKLLMNRDKTYKAAVENTKAIADENRAALEAGMSYGQYQAMKMMEEMKK